MKKETISKAAALVAWLIGKPVVMRCNPQVVLSEKWRYQAWLSFLVAGWVLELAAIALVATQDLGSEIGVAALGVEIVLFAAAHRVVAEVLVGQKAIDAEIKRTARRIPAGYHAAAAEVVDRHLVVHGITAPMFAVFVLVAVSCSNGVALGSFGLVEAGTGIALAATFVAIVPIASVAGFFRFRVLDRKTLIGF